MILERDTFRQEKEALVAEIEPLRPLREEARELDDRARRTGSPGDGTGSFFHAAAQTSAAEASAALSSRTGSSEHDRTHPIGSNHPRGRAIGCAPPRCRLCPARSRSGMGTHGSRAQEGSRHAAGTSRSPAQGQPRDGGGTCDRLWAELISVEEAASTVAETEQRLRITQNANAARQRHRVKALEQERKAGIQRNGKTLSVRLARRESVPSQKPSGAPGRQANGANSERSAVDFLQPRGAESGSGSSAARRTQSCAGALGGDGSCFSRTPDETIFPRPPQHHHLPALSPSAGAAESRSQTGILADPHAAQGLARGFPVSGLVQEERHLREADDDGRGSGARR